MATPKKRTTKKTTVKQTAKKTTSKSESKQVTTTDSEKQPKEANQESKATEETVAPHTVVQGEHGSEVLPFTIEQLDEAIGELTDPDSGRVIGVIEGDASDIGQWYIDAKHAERETGQQMQTFVDGLVRPGPNDDPDVMAARWEAMREQTPLFADTLLDMCDGEWAKEMEAHAPGGKKHNLAAEEHIDFSTSKTLLTIWGGSH